MGTTRIKVIDLSSDVEQIKTSRKRAQTGAIAEIKEFISPHLFYKAHFKYISVL